METETLTRTIEAPVALYRFFDADGALLYVGITANLGDRFRAHRAQQPWWPSVASRTVELHEDRWAAAAAEIHAIRTERPAHNIAGWTSSGRAASSPGRHSARFMLRLPVELLEAIRAEAARLGIGVSELLRIAMEAALEEEG